MKEVKVRSNKNLFIGISFVSLCIMLVISLMLYYIKGSDLASSISILGIVISIFIYFIRIDIFHPISIYTIFWAGTAGLACYKLRLDQQPWSLYMWLVVISAYITFCLGFFSIKVYRNKNKNKYNYKNKKMIEEQRVYKGIQIITVISVISFVIEVILLKFIPLFSENMSAYKDFHVTGIHYLVVLIGIIPMLTMYYRFIGGKKKILFINIISTSISILIVSRQLMLLQIVTALFCYHYYIKRISFKKLIFVGSVALVLFSLSFGLRNQSTTYFKQSTNLIVENDSVLLKPYVYFTSSFENLRNVVENFSDYKYGQNMIFPIMALTNTKEELDYSYKLSYLTNPNLNTFTYLADIYFDFGYLGVFIIPLILGIIYALLYEKFCFNKKEFISNIFILLLYCLVFCFFVNWYYNPTIFFYIIVLYIFNKYTLINKLSIK